MSLSPPGFAIVPLLPSAEFQLFSFPWLPLQDPTPRRGWLDESHLLQGGVGLMNPSCSEGRAPAAAAKDRQRQSK